MEGNSQTRRTILAKTGLTVGVMGLSGCSGMMAGSKFRLKSRHIPNVTSQYVEDPVEIGSNYNVDYSDEYKRSKVDELVETGTVSTRGWELSYRVDWGRDWRDKRQCVRRDGTYYRIFVEDAADVDRQRWQFFLGWDDQDPADDDTVVSLPLDSLSEQDRTVVAAGAEAIPPEGRRPSPSNTTRSKVIFHEELDADESELVPSPPFDYLKYEGEYFRATTAKETATRKEQTFAAELVAESRSEYDRYGRQTFPDARFSDASLSSDAASVLDEATGGDGLYEETTPLSGGLEEVLGHLSIEDDLDSPDAYDDPTWFRDAVAEYDHRWYEFDFVVYP